jgi:hypothetical protein
MPRVTLHVRCGFGPRLKLSFALPHRGLATLRFKLVHAMSPQLRKVDSKRLR